MKRWEKFSTFKERGEWVELLFMAAAAAHGYHVLKPWGDSLEYDVGIEHAGGLLRVQVKSSSVRNGTGYFCQFKPNYFSDPYTLDQLDLFAAYVIMQDTWYLIPARVLLGGEAAKQGLMLYPMQPLKKNRYSYEHYREAWPLLRPSRKR